MVHALSQSIKKCFLIVINVALFMTPVHLSEKNLNHLVIDHSSGQEVIELHIQTLYVWTFTLFSKYWFIFVLRISSVMFMYEFWVWVCFLECSVWVLALSIKERYALVQVMHVKNSFGFLWISFYEQIKYKYLYSMAWLSAQLLKMIKK